MMMIMHPLLVKHATELFGTITEDKESKRILSIDHIEGIARTSDENIAFPMITEKDPVKITKIGCSKSEHNPLMSKILYEIDGDRWIQKSRLDNAVKYFLKTKQIEKGELPLFLAKHRNDNAVYLRGKEFTYAIAEGDREVLQRKSDPVFFTIDTFNMVINKPKKVLQQLVPSAKSTTPKETLACMFLLEEAAYLRK